MGRKIRDSYTESEGVLKMIFNPTGLDGAFLIEPDRFEDERGFFLTGFHREKFKERGIDLDIDQNSVSYNRKKGTLRGMHYQVAPYEQAKLVSCFKGAIYDVIIDFREGSSTYGKWVSVDLDERTLRALYVPKGFAHGFQALEDDTVVFYAISGPYRPEHAEGIRWDDRAFNIDWPLEPSVLSEKDAGWPDHKG